MTFKYQNLNIYYEEYKGGKKELIFLHGWGNSSKTFKNQVEFLKDKYHIYLIDLPGFGKSNEQLNPYNLDDYVNLITCFVKEKEINNPILIGHSFGGRVIIKYLQKYNVEKIILIASAGIKNKKSMKKRIKIIIYKLKKKWYQITKNYVNYNYLIKTSGSTDYQNSTKILKETMVKILNEDLTKSLKNINAKTLLIWGKKDQETKIEHAYLFKKLIKNSTLTIFENAGHFVHQEEKDNVNEIIKNFIEEKEWHIYIYY